MPTPATPAVEGDQAISAQPTAEMTTTTANNPPPMPVVEEERERRSSTSSSRSGRSKPNRSTLRLVALRRGTLVLLETKAFKVASVCALVVALFGEATFVLSDVPDEPGIVIQDAIMLTATAFFVAEILLRGFAEWLIYLKSPFFAMDLVGTFSMIFEISFLLGKAGKMDTSDAGVNTVLLRTARAAKVAARAGRLTRLVKCLAVLRGDSERLKARSMLEESQMVEAKILNKRLMAAVGTRVSLLTVALVIGIPLFEIGRYPEEDLSMRAWMERLEYDYRESVEALSNDATATETNMFSVVVALFDKFYDDELHFPFKLEGYPEELQINQGNNARTIMIPGAQLIDSKEPARKQNVLRQRVSSCSFERPGCHPDFRAAAFFDFTGAAKFDAGMDIAVMIFVVLCMILESFSLSLTLDMMVVKPIERMQGHVRMMAKVLHVAGRLYPGQGGEGEEEDDQRVSLADLHTMDARTEAELMEQVFAKLSRLTSIFMETERVSHEELVEMDSEAKGVLVEILGFQETAGGRQAIAAYPHEPKHGENRLPSAHLPVEEDVINSWDLQLLPMSAQDQMKVVLYIHFDSDIGQIANRASDLDTFQRFSEKVRAGYLDNPYHCFAHACDVTSTVFRVMTRVTCEAWLSEVELSALLVSSFAHDIGHIGRTNNFLLDTMHELAIRYNDKSPLENMHCAKLFEISSQADTNIFKHYSKEDAKYNRKVCITTILHTDNAMHSEMVKEVKKVYEVCSELCNGWAARRSENEAHTYRSEVLQTNTMLWMKLILHLADISTPLKPFLISKAWATRVQDEFFDQGDEEKKLGLPVGMLNDRDKVSRPGSEHGFINFLVAPLAVASISIFPELLELGENMVDNMREWRSQWVDEIHPSAEDIKKKDADVGKVRDQIDDLAKRVVYDQDTKTVTSAANRNFGVLGRTSVGRV